MPQPIHIQDARLAQYMQLFSGVFTLPQVTIFGLCYFLRKAPWSVDELTAVRQAHFYAQVTPLVAEAHAEQRAQRPRR